MALKLYLWRIYLPFAGSFSNDLSFAYYLLLE